MEYEGFFLRQDHSVLFQHVAFAGVSIPYQLNWLRRSSVMTYLKKGIQIFFDGK